MKSRLMHLLPCVLVLSLVACAVAPSPTRVSSDITLEVPSPATDPAATSTPAPQPTPTPNQAEVPVDARATVPLAASLTLPAATIPPADPFDLISQESLFAYLEALTAIQPYSGWRNSASRGESEALDYVESVLSQFEFLQDLGLSLERQEFRVFLGTELWNTRLHLVVDDREVEVPADGLRGPRDEIAQALRFDSDGVLNDTARNPIVLDGPVLLVRTADEIQSLRQRDVDGKIVFLDYAAIDRVVQGDTSRAVGIAWDLLEEKPAGLVLVTSYSNEIGESHGSFVGDNSALNWVETDTFPPTLYVRLEDLQPIGISDWEDLERIESARLTWDADVLSPARSGNLVARIPGEDASRAVILGAHIDSPNSPGAMDDGSGSVILMEIARVLDASRTRPPVDVYLVWFGSEELGLYGSSHFVATHQELLDRTQAMLQTDMLSYPLDGIDASITLVSWSYGRLGDDRLLWPDHLARAVAERGIDVDSEDLYYVYSDNSSFGGFDVPHADQIYANESEMEATGSLHYASHIHDPYDTVELAREVGDALEQMTRVALAAALESGTSDLRVTPRSDRRALFVASHTESAHMAPTAFTDLGMTLSMEGFDVDMIPYGQAVVAADLADADLVVALPIVDYPSPEGDATLYDEAWTTPEISALESYAEQGGLLVLTTSAHRLKYGNSLLDPNEDWPDVNDLAERFGVTYVDGTFSSTQAWTEGNHPLVDGVNVLELAGGNGVPFSLTDGDVLARADGEAAVALVQYGQGQVLVLADVGILGATWGPPANVDFWRNLARYAR